MLWTSSSARKWSSLLLQCILDTREKRTLDILFDPLNISSTVCKEIRQKEKDEELLSSGTGNFRFIIYIFKANGFLALLKIFKDFYTTLLLIKKEYTRTIKYECSFNRIVEITFRSFRMSFKTRERDFLRTFWKCLFSIGFILNIGGLVSNLFMDHPFMTLFLILFLLSLLLSTFAFRHHLSIRH